ncbi:MAG: transcription elongation factor GreA [Spirochaetales bacterium]|nr:transcription elongation factor GreA [Spirochaetales bacterium]
MSEHFLDTLNQQLNDEKYTQSNLKDYKPENFLKLDAMLDEVFTQDKSEEVEEICVEHLSHKKNSIIALYLSGVINLRNQSLDDSPLLSLISLFSEGQLWEVVEVLCQKILEFGPNKHALRHLAECYSRSNKKSKLYTVWDQLIKVDYEEADIARKLGEQAEESGKKEVAIDYYKKAIHRYLNKKMFGPVMEIWQKLIELVPQEIDFFYHVETKAAKILPQERSIQLLEELYPTYKEKGSWDIGLSILKRILAYDNKNGWARKELLDCYTGKYATHSLLQNYLQLSNLSQNWREVHEAIQDFEKHISFDEGSFVFHRNWGVGRIVSITNDDITINFLKKNNHKMSLKMAVNSLTVLGKDHIWVYRLTKKKEALNKKIKEDIVWALKILIRSFDNAADMRKIKNELVPHVLSESEWSSWSTKARAQLKTNEIFGNIPDDPDTYVVRDQPISFLEKTYNRFKAEKDFDNRVKIVQEFLTHLEDGTDEMAYESDFFTEMFDYFMGFLRSYTSVSEQTIVAYVIANDFVRHFDYLKSQFTLKFKDILDQCEDNYDIFLRISNQLIRKEFLKLVKITSSNWVEVYLTLSPYYLNRDLVVALIGAGKAERVLEKFLEIGKNYKENREAFIWFVRTFYSEPWFKDYGIEQEKILISFLNLMDITAREAENRKDLTLNRKLNRQVETFLFIKEKVIESYIDEADEDGISRIYSLLEDVKELDPKIINEIKVRIKSRFTNFKFMGISEVQVTTVSRSGFYGMETSLREKQRAYNHLQQVEVPKNSEEIKTAREYGDLKENAEYKAAKERQDILNNTAARWKEEMEKVQVVRPEDVDTSKIGFGVIATLENLNTKKIESYTIMGPWESNPEKLVLSHLSPFASKLLGKKVGDVLHFTINESEYSFEVKNIEVADFDSIEPMVATV